MNKYKYNIDYFKKINSADQAYWLGFLYADGSINRFYKDKEKNIIRSLSLELNLCIQDRNHLEKFINSIESDVPIFEKTIRLNNKEYKSNKITINNTEFCNNLINLGCIPNKTYNIRLPQNDLVPQKYMRDFIRGFFDGDGCICTTECCGKPHIIVNITGMSNMLKDISDYLLNEKIIRKIPVIKNDKRNKSSSMFFYGTDSNKELLDYLYKDSNLYLDRKYDKYIKFYSNYTDIQKRGVYWSKRNKAYIVTIYINGKRIRVGQRKTLDEAIKLRKEAEINKMNILKSPSN